MKESEHKEYASLEENVSLEEWVEECWRRKRGCTAPNGTPRGLAALRQHLLIYNKGTRARLPEIDRSYCEGFMRYLRTARSRKDGTTPLSPHTQRHYMGLLRAVLGMAVDEGLLVRNPIGRLRLKGRGAQSERVFLDADELRRLAATPCKADMTRRAFLFACFCGLRISDLRQLRWGDLVTNGDGSMRLSVVMQKTGRRVSFCLPNAAVRWLPPRKADSENVFRLPSPVSVNKQVKRWAAAAGIQKHMCFHTSRHTFATMALTLGADIYTVSKLLGHANVTTTQIYARIIDRKKDEAMRLFDKFFS